MSTIRDSPEETATPRPLLGARTLLLLGVTWAGLMVAWATSDLVLSQAVVARDSTLGAIVRLVGDLPGAMLTALAVVVAGAGRRRDLPPRRDRAAFLGFVILGALPIAYALAAPLARLDAFGSDWLRTHASWVASLSIGISLAFQLAVERARPAVPAAARRWAWLTIALNVLLVVVVVGVLKILWGRARFYELDAVGVDFTPWFLPQGPNGHVSFPSGHTAWAWLGLPLLALVADASARTRAWVIAGIVALGLVVAIGRVRLGAHYASDVTFSTGAAVFLLALADRWLRRRDQSPRAKPTSAATSVARSASESTSSSGKPTTTD